ncbi:hypothetical protein M422DRAFT_258589 [Sphaerobolus stellatus SS14]|uniref:Unplaced genomic scaffold SPHSTscaffold_83, whole genome shotgun sequence n=1 Tax=Sphaerobolus stellatus (strain SS14) TaxID=990650 RepID=A0A0C9U6S8_SPHS4|nr:hypothetical protein M422DRAFT_258589 [Sphaerobolus stellatus SS14]
MSIVACFVNSVAAVYESTSIVEYRHRDPNFLPLLVVEEEPDLQIQGSWQKIQIQNQSEIPKRTTFSHFVWKGKLYIAGGMQEARSAFLKDFWCLDLNALDGW